MNASAFLLVALLAVDERATARSTPGPLRVGEDVLRTFETPHPYEGAASSTPQRVWRQEIHHPGATYICPHFSRFHLAPGDYLVVRSPDGRRSWRYEGFGKGEMGKGPDGFWGMHIPGDTAVLELWSSTRGEFGVRIDRYARGYTQAEMGDRQPEAICGADDTQNAVCYQASEPQIYDKGRAVARLLINGSGLCTGWLVGCQGHVMTNQHCIGSASDAANTNFEFMAEGATCATSCPQLACPGTVVASTSTLVQNDQPRDYALVLLPTNPSGTYGYLQLRATGAVVDERIYVPEHPGGKGKRIAVASTHTSDQSGFAEVYSLNEPACQSGGPPDVGYFADTEGGSSGSPVLGYADHRVVALHHCAACPNRGVPIQEVIAHLGANVPNCAVCDPPASPSGVAATPSGDNQIDVSWTASAGATSYKVFRALGACPPSSYELIAPSVTGTSYTDTGVSGGTTYAYAVVAVDGTTGCESAKSLCSSATATGLCTLAPTFAGLETAASSGTPTCGVNLAWSAATANCGSSVVYNVYRSEVPGFTPNAGNLLARCRTGTAFSDASAPPGTTFYYEVHAEDDSGNGGGPCGSGNQETNAAERSAAAAGPETVLLTDDIEGSTAAWVTETVSGAGAWSVVITDSHSPIHSWFIDDPASISDQRVALAADLAIPASSAAVLEFWHRVNVESAYDGGVLEYSTNSGGSWFDILEGNGGGVPANPNRFFSGGYTATLSTAYSNPLAGRSAWSGNNNAFGRVSVDLGQLAGFQARFRWRFGSDVSVSAPGWWMDDVRISYPGTCAASDLIFKDGF